MEKCCDVGFNGLSKDVYYYAIIAGQGKDRGQKSEDRGRRSVTATWGKEQGAGRRMGRAFKEDERPTSNIQHPTSNEKTNGEAGTPGRREAWKLGGEEQGGRRFTSFEGRCAC